MENKRSDSLPDYHPYFLLFAIMVYLTTLFVLTDILFAKKLLKNFFLLEYFPASWYSK